MPPIIRIPAAIVLLGVAAYLARTGLTTVFGETRAEPGVIRTGVFGIVRHPIYLSEILLYLGLLMLSISLTAAVVMTSGSVGRFRCLPAGRHEIAQGRPTGEAAIAAEGLEVIEEGLPGGVQRWGG